MKHFLAILIVIGGIPGILIMLAIIGIPYYKIVEMQWPWIDGWDWEKWGLSTLGGLITVGGIFIILAIALFVEKVIL